MLSTPTSQKSDNTIYVKSPQSYWILTTWLEEYNQNDQLYQWRILNWDPQPDDDSDDRDDDYCDSDDNNNHDDDVDDHNDDSEYNKGHTRHEINRQSLTLQSMSLLYNQN